MTGYPLDRVHQEAAFLGRNTSWTLTEILGLDHSQRSRWVVEVAALITTNDEAKGGWR